VTVKYVLLAYDTVCGSVYYHHCYLCCQGSCIKL